MSLWISILDELKAYTLVEPLESVIYLFYFITVMVWLDCIINWHEIVNPEAPLTAPSAEWYFMVHSIWHLLIYGLLVYIVIRIISKLTTYIMPYFRLFQRYLELGRLLLTIILVGISVFWDEFTSTMLWIIYRIQHFLTKLTTRITHYLRLFKCLVRFLINMFWNNSTDPMNLYGILFQRLAREVCMAIGWFTLTIFYHAMLILLMMFYAPLIITVLWIISIIGLALYRWRNRK